MQWYPKVKQRTLSEYSKDSDTQKIETPGVGNGYRSNKLP